MSDCGWTFGRRADGGLVITIDMQATPWPYDPLGWAVMLPGVEQRIGAALAGTEPPLTLRFERIRPRRAADLLLDLGDRGPGSVTVRDLQAGVDHHVQLSLAPGRSPRRRLRALAIIVRALVLLQGDVLQVTVAQQWQGQRDARGAPRRQQDAVPRRAAAHTAAGRYAPRTHRPRAKIGAASAAALDLDERPVSRFVSTPNPAPRPRA